MLCYDAYQTIILPQITIFYVYVLRFFFLKRFFRQYWNDWKNSNWLKALYALTTVFLFPLFLFFFFLNFIVVSSCWSPMIRQRWTHKLFACFTSKRRTASKSIIFKNKLIKQSFRDDNRTKHNFEISVLSIGHWGHKKPISDVFCIWHLKIWIIIENPNFMNHSSDYSVYR